MNNKEIENLKKELSKETELMISPDEVINQIKTFEKGIPFIKLMKPCTIGDGIKVIPESKQREFIEKFTLALNEGRVIKFVPASGAATRMFKKLLSILARFEKVDFKKTTELASKDDEDCIATLEFFNNIQHFAFCDELKKKAETKGKSLNDLIIKNNISELIRLVVELDGLNYANLPKGCILFHSYPDGARTAFEEHLVEAMNYSAGNDKVAKVHFTISPEHEKEIKKLINPILKKYQVKGWKFDINFSFQSPATDTISVTMDNKPFRDENGKILFRPGGHGALLKNLDDLKADIISIKNIDNIVPDHLRGETYTYKKVLGGYIIELQEKVFSLLKKLEKIPADEAVINDAIKFIKDEFENDLYFKLKEKTVGEKRECVFNFLNCPIRVCGMVKNEGHAGGGPFWVDSENGEITKQVVETTQIDHSDENQLRILDQSTHFSPVDLACGVKDYKGKNFQLDKFTNPETGLIVKKSKDGRDLKALELPGLWNGGMFYWLSVFVEVPKITFNPVKEINDLLKPEHQPI